MENKLETRSFVEYRAEKNEDENVGVITGVPIVFEQATDIGGEFEEIIARGAIDEKVLKDVAFFYNHDLNTKPLARTRTGKLQLTVEDDGVHMTANVNLERNDSKDLYLAIQDGDIDGMSFMFRVEEDEWNWENEDYPRRRITKIGYVQEVSAVNYPAYEGTEIYARANSSLDNERKALDNARAEHDKQVALDNAKAKRNHEIEILKIKLRKEN